MDEVQQQQQQRLVKVKAAKVQQTDRAEPTDEPTCESVCEPACEPASDPVYRPVCEPANEPAAKPAFEVFAILDRLGLTIFLLAVLFSGVLYLAYIQFEEINSTTNTRVNTVEQQLEKEMNPEIPTPDSRRIDLFSFGLGALLIVNLCTPPYRIHHPNSPKKPWPWSSLVTFKESDATRLKRVQAGRIASQALLHWDEPSPCYCVRALGKLLLAVFTPRNITPTELVIECYHKDEVLPIETAPWDVKALDERFVKRSKAPKHSDQRQFQTHPRYHNHSQPRARLERPS